MGMERQFQGVFTLDFIYYLKNEKVVFYFFTVLNRNFSSHEIEDSKFVNSVHGVEYEIIGEIPDAKITKKGTGISTTATFVNKYSFAPSMIIAWKKNYDYENQSA